MCRHQFQHLATQHERAKSDHTAGQANACAEVRVTIVVRVDLLFSPGDLTVFCRVEEVTTITIARRTAILIVSAGGAGVGAQIENAVCIKS